MDQEFGTFEKKNEGKTEHRNLVRMALANSSLMRAQTVLQQLLEEINFQRAKEMRQMLKDGILFNY